MGVSNLFINIHLLTSNNSLPNKKLYPEEEPGFFYGVTDQGGIRTLALRFDSLNAHASRRVPFKTSSGHRFLRQILLR